MLSARHDLVVALSDRRARIATDRPLPAGTAVFLEFADGACVDAIATDGGDDAGFVVEFVAVDPRAAEIMAHALRPAVPAVTAPPVPVGPITMSPQVAAFLSDPAGSAEGVDVDVHVDVDVEAGGAGEADLVEAAFAVVEKPLPRTRTDELFVGVTTPGGAPLTSLADAGGPAAAPSAKTGPATLVAFDLPPVTLVPAEHEPPVVGAVDGDRQVAGVENTAPRSRTATLTPMMATTAPPMPATDSAPTAQAPVDPFLGGFDVPFTGSFVAAALPTEDANDAVPAVETTAAATLSESATTPASTATATATLHEAPGPSWSPRSLNTDIGEDDSSPVEQTQRWPIARVAEVVTTSLLPLSVTPTPGVLPTLRVTAEQGRTSTPTPVPVSRPFSAVDDEPVEQTQRWPAARAKLGEVLAVEAAIEASVPSDAPMSTSSPPGDDTLVPVVAAAAEAGGDEEEDTLDAAFSGAFGDDENEDVAPTPAPAPALGAPVAAFDEAIDITMEFTGARARVQGVSMPVTRPLPEPDGGVIDVDFSEFADVLGVATFKSEAPPLVTPSNVSRIATPHPVSVSLPRTPSALSTALSSAVPAPIERNPFAGDSGKRALADSTPPTTPATPVTSLQELWVASSPQTTLPTPRLLDHELDPVLRAGGRGSNTPRPQATGDATPWTTGRDSSTPQAMPFVGDTPAPTLAPAAQPTPTPAPATTNALALAPATPVPTETAAVPLPRPPVPSMPPVAPTLPWAPARVAAPTPAPPAAVPAWPSLTPTMAPAAAPDPFASLAQPTALGNRVTPTGPTLGTAAMAGGAPGAQVLPLSPSSEGLPLIVGDDDDIPVVLGGEAFDIDDIGDIDDDNGPR